MNTIRKAIRLKKLEEAERVLQSLKDEAPVAVETQGLELELLLEQARYDEADRLGRQLATRFSDSGRIVYLAGVAAYRRRDYRRAKELLEESVRIYPHRRSKRWLAKSWTALRDFERAEALFLDILNVEPFARADLAWLYECRGEYGRALEQTERHLEDFPESRGAQAQKLRLEAKSAGRGELIEEVETLEDLGEEVPEHILTEYVKSLFTSGKAERAREVVAERKKSVGKTTLRDMAWACYKLQIHDVAFELFLMILEDYVAGYRFLNSLENAAKRAGKVEELIGVYEDLATEYPNLFGRIKKLEKGEKIP